MRKVVCVVLCVLLAGCGGEGLLLSGLDTSLQVDDTHQRTELQDRYFALMCMRAGLAGPGATLEKPSCQARLSPEDWRRVVFAALNDIDDRCEAYIKSLDKAKRDREAFLAQLRRTANITGLLLTATGVQQGSHAVSIVAVAFNFAENSLDTYYSRLLLEVKGGTIGNLVLKIQTEYRHRIEDFGLQRPTRGVDVLRPYAYYVIRGYIRICLPASIEGVMTAKIDEADFTDLPSRSWQHLMLSQGRTIDKTPSEPRLESLNVLRSGAR